MLLAMLLALATLPQERASDARCEYRSDFVAFVGRDDRGRVAFALDTNRGRDRDAYQAENFAVLYAEGQGWIELAGNGEFPNTERRLEPIASSKHYRYEGTPAAGLRVAGASNALELTIEPIALHSRRERRGASFDVGSAAAKLVWKERTFAGRVIFEGCYLPDRNLITSPDPDFFGDGWHGLYALVDSAGDLRLHRADGDAAKLLLPEKGTLRLEGEPRPAKHLELEVEAWTQGRGFFRWPTGWRASWLDEERPVKLAVELEDREVILSWVVGGFAVAIAKGELELDGRRHEVWGLAQVIR